ncbi:sulfotransferase domain-containing protein [Paraglaciecola marina]|uniref:sulfotransferase domain-containing protein n=1 Tax=Paraglaciecola marina TaxID=2500157 RepID=UPI00105F6A54|nr:sulfotransferase domain-containing protein [Paraglaciecola marina]
MMHVNVFCNHKCGTVWLFKYLKTFAQLNDFQYVSSNRGWKGFEPSELADNAVVMYRNAQYEVISKTCNAGVRIIRDPRALVNSAYFSHLNTHNVDDWLQLKKQRTLLQQMSEQDGIRMTLAFTEKSQFYHGTKGPLCALGEWQFDDHRYLPIRMEDFVIDPLKYMKRTIVVNGGDPEHFTYPDSDEFSFAKLTGRTVGEVNDSSHFRSGDPQDWKKHLPDDVKLYLQAHFSYLISEFYS